MNYIYRITLAFMYYTDAALIVFANTVLVYMAAAILYFPTPNPTLAGMQLLYNNFLAAIAAAANGGKILTLAKNQARADLLIGMRMLALYVEANGNNDPETLLSSGFLIHGGAKTLQDH